MKFKRIILPIVSVLTIAVAAFGIRFVGMAHKTGCIGKFCYEPETQLNAEFFYSNPDEIEYISYNHLNKDKGLASIYRDCTENMLDVFGERLYDDLIINESTELQYTVRSLEGRKLCYFFFVKDFNRSRAPTAFAILIYPEMSEFKASFSPEYLEIAENLDKIVYEVDLPQKILSRCHYDSPRFFLRFQRRAENIDSESKADGFSYREDSEYVFDEIKDLNTVNEVREAAARGNQPFELHSKGDGYLGYYVLSLKNKSLCYYFFLNNTVLLAVEYPSLENTDEFYSMINEVDYPVEIINRK